MPRSGHASRRVHRKQAAAHLGVSLSWFDKSRLSGDGPPFIKIGNRVIYDEADLDEFMDRNRHRSTSSYSDASLGPRQ
jgi:predicted DNA-binding transcriptional regulator AlpA